MSDEITVTISQQSICKFIEDKHTSGALLVTGEWGSGKTFFLKNLAQKYNKDKYAIVHISLFGRDSSEEIEHDIKKDPCYIYSTIDIAGSNSDNKRAKQLKVKSIRKKINEKSSVSKFMNGARILTGHFKDTSKIVKGIDSIINFNYWDFIDLESSILGRKVVIIFDDFERCSIKLDILLGIINEYSENIGIKVIIVANDDKIKKQKKFLKFKEKVVYRTIKLEQNAKYVLSALIKEIDSRSSEYQRYLEKHFQEIIQIFYASTYNNFRSLRTAIIDFEKIYSLFIKKTKYLVCNKLEQYEEKTLLLLLKQFFAFIMEASAGEDIYSYFFDMFTNQIDEDEDGLPVYLEYLSEKTPLFVSKYPQDIFDINYAPKAIIEWVAKGIYNEENIEKCIEAYIDNYKPHIISDMELFLTTQILYLDNIEQLNKGYIEALSNAYTGKLTSEQYLSLLHQIFCAKKIGLTLPENPNYDNMTKGFESIERFDEEEPVFGGFGHRSEEAASNLKKEIEASIRNRTVNKRAKDYYNYCLSFFRSCNIDDNKHLGYSERIELVLDDEMVDAVVKAFKSAKNKKRGEIVSSFLNIRFSNYKDKVISTKLIQKLTNLKNKDIVDPLGIANLDYFILEAKQRFLLNPKIE